MLAIGTVRWNAATHAARHRMYPVFSSSTPPTPWISLRGCWATSSSRGSTWPSTGAALARSSRRPAGTPNTIAVASATAASTK
jgi:hypothetical protein